MYTSPVRPDFAPGHCVLANSTCLSPGVWAGGQTSLPAPGRAGVLSTQGQVLLRHCFRKPYPVSRAVKLEAVAGHCRRIYVQDNRFSVPLADPGGRLLVQAQVNVLALPGLQPCPHNGGNRFGRSAVIKDRRWWYGVQLQVNGDAMALIGANPVAVGAEAEPFFVVFCDNDLQFFAPERCSGCRQAPEEVFDSGPAVFVKLQADGFWLVA